MAPAWPREWAQRVGRTAEALGGKHRVMPDPESRAWTLSWYLAGHRVLTFRPGPKEVHVLVRLPERVVPSLVEDHQVDEEFRESLLRAKPLRGIRSVRVVLDSAPRANTLGRVLEGIAHRAEGP